jgi:hypothetical protein
MLTACGTEFISLESGAGVKKTSRIARNKSKREPSPKPLMLSKSPMVIAHNCEGEATIDSTRFRVLKLSLK